MGEGGRRKIPGEETDSKALSSSSILKSCSLSKIAVFSPGFLIL